MSCCQGAGFSAAQCDLSQPGRPWSCSECGSTVRKQHSAAASRRSWHVVP